MKELTEQLIDAETCGVNLPMSHDTRLQGSVEFLGSVC